MDDLIEGILRELANIRQELFKLRKEATLFREAFLQHAFRQ